MKPGLRFANPGPGFADGPGPTAKFYGPAGVAVDASGAVYVGDYTNNRIRVVK
ncbi:hypothetical protein JAO73_03180 [Hymenobacter sp. BT523]|uniref:hypothetical protein n=1 Tax=Hymenobacter sp. BT523 TaxID=2795725 RepID=UPI0018EAF0B9|nr:hypothetical protein [Hymenobacter sp. BT523]MBJ6108000.1 hypothetical protein [Hymenobacter sp. BT523]